MRYFQPIVITIDDVNDNSPVWGATSAVFTMSETNVATDVLGTLPAATDADLTAPHKT